MPQSRGSNRDFARGLGVLAGTRSTGFRVTAPDEVQGRRARIGSCAARSGCRPTAAEPSLGDRRWCRNLEAMCM
jgi:hypothetical protein